MADNESNPNTAAETTDSDFGLRDFHTPSDDEGVSLDELSNAYAELIGSGQDPYDSKSSDTDDDLADDLVVSNKEDSLDESDRPELSATSNDNHPTSPKSILEAILFVGQTENDPLKAKVVAALMRGVRPSEVEQWVVELNAEYALEDCPYRIVSVDAGYRLDLHEDFANLRDSFYGRVREARLSQAAIDVLAVVAYNQPISREEIQQLQGKPVSSVLTQLVRRQLLQMERRSEKPRVPIYSTTDRFQTVFGLTSLDDLPQSEEFDQRVAD